MTVRWRPQITYWIPIKINDKLARSYTYSHAHTHAQHTHTHYITYILAQHPLCQKAENGCSKVASRRSAATIAAAAPLDSMRDINYKFSIISKMQSHTIISRIDERQVPGQADTQALTNSAVSQFNNENVHSRKNLTSPQQRPSHHTIVIYLLIAPKWTTRVQRLKTHGKKVTCDRLVLYLVQSKY